MELHQTPTPGVTSVTPRRLRAAPDPRTDAGRSAEVDLDALFELLERGPLSAAELRILLALRDGERRASELAASFGRRSVEIRRSAARLLARGRISWRHDGPATDPVFGITPTGLATLRPLLVAGPARVQAA